MMMNKLQQIVQLSKENKELTQKIQCLEETIKGLLDPNPAEEGDEKEEEKE